MLSACCRLVSCVPKTDVFDGAGSLLTAPASRRVKPATIRKARRTWSTVRRIMGPKETAFWRRGWDTHLVSFAILPSFQQHALKPHEYWRFLRFRIPQIIQSFRINSTNFGPKQTPKTPSPRLLHRLELPDALPQGLDPSEPRRRTMYSASTSTFKR